MSETSDLTSLSWLHNLNILNNLPVTTAPPTPPASPLPCDAARGTTGAVKDGKSASGLGKRSSSKEDEKEIDYKVVGDVKPPYSYASLICMAMKSNKHKMTLSSIYKWIKENFLYYRNADPSWQVIHSSIDRQAGELAGCNIDGSLRAPLSHKKIELEMSCMSSASRTRTRGIGHAAIGSCSCT